MAVRRFNVKVLDKNKSDFCKVFTDLNYNEMISVIAENLLCDDDKFVLVDSSLHY